MATPATNDIKQLQQSRKSRKSKKGGDSDDAPVKKKRKAPAHATLQTEVIKMIVAKDGINYPKAMGKMKVYMTKALGKPYADAKADGMTYIEALKKTKAHLQK